MCSDVMCRNGLSVLLLNDLHQAKQDFSKKESSKGSSTFQAWLKYVFRHLFNL